MLPSQLEEKGGSFKPDTQQHKKPVQRSEACSHEGFATTQNVARKVQANDNEATQLPDLLAQITAQDVASPCHKVQGGHGLAERWLEEMLFRCSLGCPSETAYPGMNDKTAARTRIAYWTLVTRSLGIDLLEAEIQHRQTLGVAPVCAHAKTDGQALILPKVGQAQRYGPNGGDGRRNLPAWMTGYGEGRQDGGQVEVFP